MKRILMAAAVTAILYFGLAAGSPADPRPIKLFMKPTSMVPTSQIVRHLSSHCPNVSITIVSKKSDYELEANGLSGAYNLNLYAHGGARIYSTQTQRLGNAVKDVCQFLNSQSAPQ